MSKNLIRLSLSDYRKCLEEAQRRQSNRTNAGSVDLAPKDLDPLKLNNIGIFGEVALHRYLGVNVDWFELGDNSTTGISDVLNFIEVRSTTPKHFSPLGTELDLRESDLRSSKHKKTFTSAWVKVVVSIHPVEPPICEIVGWSMGYKIILNNKLVPRRKGDGKCIYCPDSQLDVVPSPDAFIEQVARFHKIASQCYESQL